MVENGTAQGVNTGVKKREFSFSYFRKMIFVAFREKKPYNSLNRVSLSALSVQADKGAS
jgi:hypothetical protein